MTKLDQIESPNKLLWHKRLLVSYLFYFFLLQPAIGFFFPDWGSQQVFQLVEEEDSGQSRILEERVCHTINDNFFEFNLGQIDEKHQHQYFFYISLYQEFKSETPNPPPERFI